MRIRTVIALSIALVSAIAPCVAAPVTFQDASGKTVTLPSPARRIVSLTPAVTEILFEAGAGDSVVGVTKFCNYPEAAKKKPQVAGYGPKSVNMEAIIALAPDVVIGEEAAYKPLAGAFAGLGLRLVLLKIADFEGVARAIEFSGELAGTVPRAKAAADTFRKRVSAVTSRIASAKAPRPLVFYEVWDSPLMTAGSGTFIDILIEGAGGRNCFHDVGESYPTVSFEQIVSRDPEFILAPTTHGDKMTPENLGKRPGWSSLKAIKDGKVRIFADDIVSRPGPRLAEALEQIAAYLHPGLFADR